MTGGVTGGVKISTGGVTTGGITTGGVGGGGGGAPHSTTFYTTYVVS
jgi:hypothetical protein